MTTEDALAEIKATLRRVAPDHARADFPATYAAIRGWFRVPIDDRRDELFQIVCGPGTTGLGWFSSCRVLTRTADGAVIQLWVSLSQERRRPAGADWANRVWYQQQELAERFKASYFATPEEGFAAVEALPEFRAAATESWHVQVGWHRHGER